MEPESTESASRLVVLLVDDQAMVAEGIRRMLEDEADIDFHYCQDPREALQMATEVGATTILQDLVMPGIDGLMLVRFYRSNPDTRDIPVIVLSSKEDPNTKSEAFRNGANDYLVKLPDKIELVARIQAHSRSYLAHRERDEAYQKLRDIQRQLEHSNARLEESNRELQRLSSLDGLTGIANRRQFDKTLEQEWRRARRNRSQLSLIMLDIDYFKHYNDHLGHQCGDDCLRSVARALDEVVCRNGDLIARYGGEEFAVIMPDTSLKGAHQVAENIRQAITDLQIEHPASDIGRHLTLSIGVASAEPSEQGSPAALLTRADQALYQAKDKGRNRIELAAPLAGPRPASVGQA
ncbi:PleD family two-component system response regulator [Thiohalobacter sp. IOR34]|uniref:response regulator n=1 Tax=Thiohalobacter sp. IOR34 TaxID=3057176 RepID=UPI0025AF8844|nr:PleD family two-component system response regulator [Thiohalobacter sp. IOR34]WJW74750.1 PleD family two-component system response regulator [Thiohalobacter sp. IOR34]